MTKAMELMLRMQATALALDEMPIKGNVRADLAQSWLWLQRAVDKERQAEAPERAGQASTPCGTQFPNRNGELAHWHD